MLADSDAGGGCKREGKHCRRDAQCCSGLICGDERACVPGCRIDGVLYGIGDSNPANECQVCRPELATGGWSSVNDGSPCNDGNACSTADACGRGECHGGPPASCDDRNICTKDSCDPAAGCVNTQVPDGEACDMWVTDGAVTTSALRADTLYIGGGFNWVSPIATGGFVPLDAITALPPHDFPRVLGTVTAAAPDGAGGWFIAGSFTRVGLVARSGLAHILADGSVADWSPRAAIEGVPNAPNQGEVRVLAVRGDRVFVGGVFNRIGGQTRNSLAALDATTGQATDWDPDAQRNDVDYPPFVYAFELAGPLVYVGGYYTSIGGEPRNSLAAIDAATGLATAWNPDPQVTGEGGLMPGTVTTLTVSGGRVYVGGSFETIGGQPRVNLAAVDTATGLATAWNPGVTRTYYGDPNVTGPGEVRAIAARTGRIYVGGFFDTIGGQPRDGVASLDAATGLATDWNPRLTGSDGLNFGVFGVLSLALDVDRVFFAGNYEQIDGQTRTAVAAVDAATGALSLWDPAFHGGSGEFVAVDGGRVVVGGPLNTMGGVERHGLAAIDVRTGRPTDWSPGLSVARSLIVDGDTMFVQAFGLSGYGISALDLPTGQTLWHATVLGGGLTLAGNSLYSCSAVGVQPSSDGRASLYTIDAGTGQVSESSIILRYFDGPGGLWTLGADVHAVYLGGQFDQVSGQPRNALAAVDPATGLATPWDVGFGDDFVRVLATDGSAVYAGGSFVVDGLGVNFGAFDPASGDLMWSRVVRLASNVIKPSGDLIYVGGVPGLDGSLIALDAATGSAADWHPIPTPNVRSIAPGEGVVFVGGTGNYMTDNRIYKGLYAIAAGIAHPHDAVVESQGLLPK